MYNLKNKPLALCHPGGRSRNKMEVICIYYNPSNQLDLPSGSAKIDSEFVICHIHCVKIHNV